MLAAVYFTKGTLSVTDIRNTSSTPGSNTPGRPAGSSAQKSPRASACGKTVDQSSFWLVESGDSSSTTPSLSLSIPSPEVTAEPYVLPSSTLTATRVMRGPRPRGGAGALAGL